MFSDILHSDPHCNCELNKVQIVIFQICCYQVHRILHLIGLSLREEERRRGSDPEARENSIEFEFTKRAEKFKIFGQMEQLVGSQRIEGHKHLLNWTIKKWQEVAGNKSKNNNHLNTRLVWYSDESSILMFGIQVVTVL